MNNENSTNADATNTTSKYFYPASGITISTGSPVPFQSQPEFRTLFEYEEVSVCKKCGRNGIDKSYYGKNELQEWLSRSCPNCGYHWFMHTRDYETPKPACGREGCKC